MENCNKPVRVLQVLAIMNRGGAETMVMNYYRALDRSQMQFDFLVNYPQRGDYDDEIEAMGGRIFRSMPIRPWSYHKYFKWLDNFFKEHHDYVAVHSHIQENSGMVLKYAGRYGIERLIANSHQSDLGFDYKFLFRHIGRFFTHKYATHRFACGEKAGKFLFNRGEEFMIFNNGVDVDRLAYNVDTRVAKRAELGINDGTIVVGHVGRFNPQKNHKFLIDIFAEIHRQHPDSILLMVGEGYLRKEIEAKVEALSLSDSARFLGLRSDVADLLQAMDVLLFPSLFEGLPVSIVEAQAASLPCVLSDTIDHDTDISGRCLFIPLNADTSQWASSTINYALSKRTDNSDAVRKAGYDVKVNVLWLTEFYKGTNQQPTIRG